MSDVAETQDIGADLAWGAGPIGKAIGQNRRQAAHMLELGVLPAKKVGGRWVASRSALRAFFLNVPAPREAPEVEPAQAA